MSGGGVVAIIPVDVVATPEVLDTAAAVDMAAVDDGGTVVAANPVDVVAGAVVCASIAVDV